MDTFPHCTPDGKWLYYVDRSNARAMHVLRLSIQDGAIQQVAMGKYFDLSPDSKMLATATWDGSPRLRLISAETLQELTSFPLPPSSGDFLYSDDFASLAFSADNKAIFYITHADGGTTIWRQPLDASAAVKVATFPGKFVQQIRVSPDNTKLGFTVSAPQSEAVLIRDDQ
jgi:hypothetical protein